MDSVVALLGRRDTPVDGVEDYCTFLSQALKRYGVSLELVRVPWAERGWPAALRELRGEAQAWRGRWVLLQYTALSWSSRGFPVRLMSVLRALKNAGTRVAIVFHEPSRQADSSSRLLDPARGVCQDWVIREMHAQADKCIFADPLETVSWLPKQDAKSSFVPIGANIPEMPASQAQHADQNGAVKTVAVFCLSEPPNRTRELGDITQAVRRAAASGVKMKAVFLGRGTPEARDEIAHAFRDVPAEVTILGLLSASQVTETLAGSDAMLCVRGIMFPRRASAIAGIACGLPVIGYAGQVERTPLAEAGLQLVPYPDREAVAAALARVLTDDDLRRTLREQSIRAQQMYFSWDKIAQKILAALEGAPPRPELSERTSVAQ